MGQRAYKVKDLFDSTESALFFYFQDTDNERSHMGKLIYSGMRDLVKSETLTRDHLNVIEKYGTLQRAPYNSDREHYDLELWDYSMDQLDHVFIKHKIIKYLDVI